MIENEDEILREITFSITSKTQNQVSAKHHLLDLNEHLSKSSVSQEFSSAKTLLLFQQFASEFLSNLTQSKTSNDLSNDAISVSTSNALTTSNSCSSSSSTTESNCSLKKFSIHALLFSNSAQINDTSLNLNPDSFKSLSNDLSTSVFRKCSFCDQLYPNRSAYSTHLRTHYLNCNCSFCGKHFTRPWLLQGHLRTHTGEKPFSCHVCAKSFADKSNLRAHIQTHSVDKPYRCGKCGKRFALKSYLSKHTDSACIRKELQKFKQINQQHHSHSKKQSKINEKFSDSK